MEQNTLLSSRPLILFNDKRYHTGIPKRLQSDRRMILDLDELVANLTIKYSKAEVVAVRFRDLPWPDQLRVISQARVFITTQGSSAFRWLWLPPGATCIVIGAPEGPQRTEWQSFHELDRWFPLSYVSFQRYTVDINKTDEYVVNVVPGHWQPNNPEAARHWWLYNADVRLRMQKIEPMLDHAMGGIQCH